MFRVRTTSRHDRKLADETTNLVRSYTLPDGRVITLGAERFAAPGALPTRNSWTSRAGHPRGCVPVRAGERHR